MYVPPMTRSLATPFTVALTASWPNFTPPLMSEPIAFPMTDDYNLYLYVEEEFEESTGAGYLDWRHWIMQIGETATKPQLKEGGTKKIARDEFAISKAPENIYYRYTYHKICNPGWFSGDGMECSKWVSAFCNPHIKSMGFEYLT